MLTVARNSLHYMFEHSWCITTCNSHGMLKCGIPCFRCQASEGNGKPGMLWGIRNAFHGLGFGSQPSESNAKQPDPEPEEELQQQPANDTPQRFDGVMPWSTWKKVTPFMLFAKLLSMCNAPQHDVRLLGKQVGSAYVCIEPCCSSSETTAY